MTNPSDNMRDRRTTGKRGEELAARFLAKRGYALIDANWRTRIGEIDLITKTGETLVFVEVRSRTGRSHGTAGESIGPIKQRQITRMAEQYLQYHATPGPCRIDVVTVDFLPDGQVSIEHLIGAVDIS